MILKVILIDEHLCGSYNKMLAKIFVEKCNQTQEQQGCCKLIFINQLNSYLFPDGKLVMVYGLILIWITSVWLMYDRSIDWLIDWLN